MLNPEVWNFKAPESKFTSTVSANTLPTKINTFYYNHLISLITPSGVQLPKGVLLDDSDYYKLKDITLDTLVSKEFINNFVIKGELTALTISTRIDCDNCVCITPCGKLILSLTKDSYGSLGLQGTQSHFTKNTKDRYVVTVDLRGRQLVENRKNSEVPQCLRKLGRFTFIAIWEPPSAQVCPSSLAKYFNELGFEVILCVNTQQYQVQKDVKVPVVRYEDEEEVIDVVEWLGMVTMKCPESYCNTFLSSYTTPSPFVTVPSIGTHQFRGFFTPKRIVKFINALKNAFKDQWFSIYVQGFSDSPINWHFNEHHYYTNGDNSYVFLFNRYKYMFATNQTTNKRYK